MLIASRRTPNTPRHERTTGKCGSASREVGRPHPPSTATLLRSQHPQGRHVAPRVASMSPRVPPREALERQTRVRHNDRGPEHQLRARRQPTRPRHRRGRGEGSDDRGGGRPRWCRATRPVPEASQELAREALEGRASCGGSGDAHPRRVADHVGAEERLEEEGGQGESSDRPYGDRRIGAQPSA